MVSLETRQVFCPSCRSGNTADQSGNGILGPTRSAQCYRVFLGRLASAVEIVVVVAIQGPSRFIFSHRHWSGLTCDRQRHEGRYDAKEACRKERRQVTCELSPGQPGAECRTGGTELMPGIDPAENEIGAPNPEVLRCEPHRGWHGCDPIESVDHCEQRQPIERKIGKRQK